jgi:hypothetical protein
VSYAETNKYKREKLQILPDNCRNENGVDQNHHLRNWHNIFWSECALTVQVKPTFKGLQTLAAAFREQSPEI